jgi:two-component sensor histidine kinase
MKRFIFLFLLLSYNAYSFSQVNVLSKKDNQVLEHFQVLADDNYSIERIIKDSSLAFANNPVLSNFSKNKAYWLKCTVNNPLEIAKEYYVSIFPIMENTLYYYDKETKNWEAKKDGLGVKEGLRKVCFLPIILYSGNNTFYIKMDVHTVEKYKYRMKSHIRLVDYHKYKKNEQRITIYWIITLAIIFLLFLYNLYTYYVFKDKTFLYYLWIVFGGMLYITSLHKFFNILLPYRSFEVLLSKEGYIYTIDFNGVVIQIAIVLVITGFVQFTRTYLQTKIIFPKWDATLKYLNILYTIFSLFVTILTFTGIWYNFHYSTLYLNIIIVVIILLLILMGILAYKGKHPFGKYYLLANVLPLLLMLCVAIYFIMVRSVAYGDGANWLPNLAIVSLILTFGIGLAARINVLKKDLGNEQLQAALLKNNLQAVEQSSKEKDLFLKEIHHRVKNNLQIISGLLYMQFKDNKDEQMRNKLKQAQERIKSMALVHNKLYETEDNVHVYIKEYIKDLAASIVQSNTPAGKSIVLHIEENEPINLSLDTSISLGLILNELITNSCKYAFGNKDKGQIAIAITKQTNGYQITVQDDGSGLAKNYEEKNSLGLHLVTNLAKQLGGSALFENKNGTIVTILFKDIAA